MNIRFCIFGVPDGFDFYGEQPTDKVHFQSYYDNSKENVKFTIHRDMSGEVSYTYLRYNLVSSKSRTGAFFGMSVIFEKAYCSDTYNLFSLFDTIYNKLIVVNKVILEEKKVQADKVLTQFMVPNFASCGQEIAKIEANVINNISNSFATDIIGLNSGFGNDFPSALVKIELPNSLEDSEIEKYNEVINQKLHRYSWISLAKEYKRIPVLTPNGNNADQEDFDLSPERRQVLLKALDQYRTELIDAQSAYINLTSIPTTDPRHPRLKRDALVAINSYENIEIALREIQKYTKKNDSLAVDFEGIFDKFKRLHQDILGTNSPQDLGTSGIRVLGEGEPASPEPFFKKYMVHISLVIVICVVGLVAFLICQRTPSNPPKGPDPYGGPEYGGSPEPERDDIQERINRVRADFQKAIDLEQFNDAYDKAYGLSHQSNEKMKAAGQQMLEELKNKLRQFIRANKSHRKAECISILNSAIEFSYAYQGAEQDLQELTRPVDNKPPKASADTKPSSISIIDSNGNLLTLNDVLKSGQSYKIIVNNKKEGYKVIIERGNNKWEDLTEIQAHNGTYKISYTGPDGTTVCSLTMKCQR